MVPCLDVDEDCHAARARDHGTWRLGYKENKT